MTLGVEGWCSIFYENIENQYFNLFFKYFGLTSSIEQSGVRFNLNKAISEGQGYNEVK